MTCPAHRPATPTPGRAVQATALIATLIATLLAACSSGPPVPDWQVASVAHMRRHSQNWLAGHTRVAQRALEQAREQAASTGQPAQLARVELTHCALQVASLDFTDCPAFAPLQPDAPPAELAYARWIGGQPLAPEQIALLPAAHRPLASASAAAGAPLPDAAALQAIADPLTRLVAAGALMRRGQAGPAHIAIAADTASAQGWRRPLLAWLGLQLRQAQQNGDTEQTQRLERRIRLIAPAPESQSNPTPPAAP